MEFAELTSNRLSGEAVPSAEVDMASLAWQDLPEKDAVGADIEATEAYKVKTHEELAAVIAYARDNGLLLQPAGKFTSSKAFRAPPSRFMRYFKKRGLCVVGFDPDGPFGEIHVDEHRRVVTAGAAVTLAQLSEAVRNETYDPALKRARMRNLMTITTMDVGAVATALGTGGVADSSESATSLMMASQWMDGMGRLHSETYSPRTYWGYSSFDEVHKGRVGQEMTGRGGPFGIGTQVSFRLDVAPGKVHTVIFPFEGSLEKVREDLIRFTLDMNQAHARYRYSSRVNFRLEGLELMDRNAMLIAKHGCNGWAPGFGTVDPQMIVIATFTEFTNGKPIDPEEGLTEAGYDELVDLGFLKDEWAMNCIMPEASKVEQIDKFRLQGPEHLRALKKRHFASANTISTDWAVDATDERLVQWFMDGFFRIGDAMHDHIAGHAGMRMEALYGHLLTRLDPHWRVVVEDDAVFAEHLRNHVDFGHAIVDLQLAGERVRWRGEKRELTRGPALECVAKRRSDSHSSSNVDLLRDLDEAGIFGHLAPERWRGRWDWPY